MTGSSEPSPAFKQLEKHRSFQMPLIPPLKSSVAVIDKENKRNERQTNEDGNRFAKATSSSPFRTTQTATKNHRSSPLTLPPIQQYSNKNLPLPKIAPAQTDTDRSFTTSSPSLSQRRRVLRYGETMESLFMLDSSSSEEYLKICRQIVDGTAADDASIWRQVLQQATQVAQNKGSSTAGADLIRLHRRATSRFTSDNTHHPSTDIVEIWLSYAQAQISHGMEKDARLTLRHIQNQRIGEKHASFYLALFQLERRAGNHSVAKQALQMGIQKQAEPLQLLKDALETLGNPKSESTGIAAKVHSVKLSPKKRRLEQGSSPKRRKTETGAIKVFHDVGLPDERTENSNMSLETEGASQTTEGASSMSDLNESKDSSIRFQLAPLSRLNLLMDEVPKITATVVFEQEKQKEQPVKPPEDGDAAEALIDTKETTSGIENAEMNKPSKATTPSTSMKVKSTRISMPSGGKSTSRRPPLLSKTPRLSRVGLSGKAQRVDPNHSVDVESESESEPESTGIEPTEEIKSSTKKSKPATKITKMDLNYMWEWDPNKPQDNASNKNQTSHSIKTSTLEKIDEAPSLSSSTGSASMSNASSSRHSSVGRDAFATRDTTEKAVKTNGSDSHGGGRRQHSLGTPQQVEVAPETAALISRSNADFLPLVGENNILRVNGVPYAKLGVIGKGGSCKVYRALSKDCSVLAIKKVKIGGMDKKAIEGYANEIALLKRLRGNPAIIHMFDSQVDLERKAIFVVMELGEVDLNHVLQQQAIIAGRSSSGERRHLNINFIRLTWQQMLSAVHCIHEERIVHGDLKPSNFLFVRGALKLIDFGIAKAIQSDDTTNIYRESQIGTLNYMSPEAILDTGSGTGRKRIKVGRASDIWSLGCILYQMVYGKTPFAELHMFPKLQAIVNPNHEIQYRGNVDEDAVDAMKKCLRRTPEERPPIFGRGGLLNEHIFLNSRRQHGS